MAEIGLKGHEDLPSKHLSQGQKRRVALARLLANDASVWILDEPFTALDVAAVQLLQDVIRRHVENGGMAIITTHQEVAMIGEHTRTITLGQSMLEPLFWIIRRDLTIAMRRRADVFTTLIFFAIVVSLFPLGIGPEPNTLRLIAPGIVWVGALLASMLALEQIFSADHRDGTLEQMLLTPQPVALLVAGKVLAHWLVSGVPLVLMAPLLGLQFDLSWDALQTLIVSLLLGTPTLSLIGAIGAALTLGLRSGGVLLALLVLPLYIPVLIFGAGAVEATVSGLGGQSPTCRCWPRSWSAAWC